MRSTGAESWDVHEAAAELEIARDHWKPALTELQSALTLSPSNALVHARLAQVYLQLNEPVKAKEHTEAALRFDRGEFSAALRRESHMQLALAGALVQGKSGDLGSLDDLKRRAEGGEVAAQLALAKICLRISPHARRKACAGCSKPPSRTTIRPSSTMPGRSSAYAGTTPARRWFVAHAVRQQGNARPNTVSAVSLRGQTWRRDNVAAGQWILLAAGQGRVEAKRLLKEMELFLSADEFAEARNRADAFKPVKQSAANPKK